MTIDGRAINSSTVGVTTPAEGRFTTLRGAYVSTSVHSADYTITAYDLGGLMVMNAPSIATFTLPAVGASEDGAHVMIANQSDNQLGIQAQAGDYIMDSSAGGFCYNAGTSSFIELVYHDASSVWLMRGGAGTWTTG